MLGLYYFYFLLILSLVCIIVGGGGNNKSFLISGLILFIYSGTSVCMLMDKSTAFDLRGIIYVYCIFLNDVFIVSMCGILFGSWDWHLTSAFNVFLCSILAFAYEYNYVEESDKMVIETIETYKKRITFIEVD